MMTIQVKIKIGIEARPIINYGMTCRHKCERSNPRSVTIAISRLDTNPFSLFASPEFVVVYTT